jgi:pentatricopeptide repeat protein
MSFGAEEIAALGESSQGKTAHGSQALQPNKDRKYVGRSPGSSPLNVATPSRGGRGGRGDGEKGRERGPASALEDLMRRRGVDEAWNSLEEMQAQGTTTDKYTVSRMLMKTVGDGRARLNNVRVYRAIFLVEKFIEMQPHDVDEVLFNALLDTCGRLKDLPRLEQTVQRMRDLKVTPSPVTLGILVKTYGQAGDIQKVLQVWDEMEKQRVQANAVTYGCMIDACVKCGRLETAVEIFKGMRQAGKHRNTILYTTLIKGYGLEKDLKSALELFREMPREGVPYNTITYNSIIDACVKNGDLATAEALLHEIADPIPNCNNPVEPDLITFSTLLKGYCHIGSLDNALQLAEAIKARGLRCDELVYNTLMDGCVKANDVAAGVGLFEEMVHAGMRPSSITHSILARLYQRAGYEEEATEAVAQLYAHHGIERPCGGDRARGAGRRGQRSPGGRYGPDGSPHGSPLVGYGMQRNDSCWSTWSETQSSCGGFDPFTDPLASAPATPHGSPMASHQNCGYLPFDAMRGMPPPLPGMGGSDTPHSSSCRGATPISGAFQSSPVGSPCPLPYGEHPQQCQMMGIPVAPNSAPGQGMPSLPPFPFTGQSADPSLPQFFVQQAPTATNMQGPPPQGWVSPMAQGHVDSSMSMAAPHPVDAPFHNQPQMQGQAFFESYTPTNQQVVGMPMNGCNGSNPFCL